MRNAADDAFQRSGERHLTLLSGKAVTGTDHGPEGVVSCSHGVFRTETVFSMYAFNDFHCF